MTNNVVGANAKRLSAVVLAVVLAGVLAVAIGAGAVGPERSASAQPGPAFPLSVVKVAYPRLEVPYPLGTHIDYLITVQNNTPVGSPPVTLTDSLPGGVGFISANASQGNCTAMADRPEIRCELGSIPPGNVAHVNIIVRAESPGTYTNAAEALGNQDTETITIAPANPGGASVATAGGASARICPDGTVATAGGAQAVTGGGCP